MTDFHMIQPTMTFLVVQNQVDCLGLPNLFGQTRYAQQKVRRARQSLWPHWIVWMDQLHYLYCSQCTITMRVWVSQSTHINKKLIKKLSKQQTGIDRQRERDRHTDRQANCLKILVNVHSSAITFIENRHEYLLITLQHISLDCFNN